MLNFLRFGSFIFFTITTLFVLSSSALQACVVLPGKPLDEQCKGDICIYEYAKKANITKVSCDFCDSSGIVNATEDVILNIRGMTCAGCEGMIKKTLSAFEGVSDVSINYKQGKADLHLESGEGKASIENLIEALEHIGFKVTQG